jgi:hypothetical protein
VELQGCSHALQQHRALLQRPPLHAKTHHRAASSTPSTCCTTAYVCSTSCCSGCGTARSALRAQQAATHVSRGSRRPPRMSHMAGMRWQARGRANTHAPHACAYALKHSKKARICPEYTTSRGQRGSRAAWAVAHKAKALLQHGLARTRRRKVLSPQVAHSELMACASSHHDAVCVCAHVCVCVCVCACVRPTASQTSVPAQAHVRAPHCGTHTHSRRHAHHQPQQHTHQRPRPPPRARPGPGPPRSAPQRAGRSG